MSASHEVEAKLRVVAAEAGRVFARVGALRSLAGCTLEPRPCVLQTDTYFDSAAGDLRQAGYGLRLREKPAGSGRLRLTLKGPAARAGAASLRRFELEEDWSPGAWSRVRSAAREAGVRGIGEARSAHGAPAAETLGAAGLAPFQVRSTSRTTLLARRAGEHEPAAEIVLDAVRYRFGELEVLHHEIEIEALGDAGADVVESLVAALLAEVESGLVPWTLDKTALGAALEARARSGELVAELDAEGRPGEHLYRALVR